MNSHRRQVEPTFHHEGWHPVSVTALGAIAGVALVATGYAALRWGAGMHFEGDAGTVLAALVTATVGGGAAGLTMKNLNLKRAESRRATNLMFDNQLQTGASMLGSENESSIRAGALLLGSLLRESPRHAQACADLLCASLRPNRPGDLSDEDGTWMMEENLGALVAARAEGNRIRSSITKAIATAAQQEHAPPHVNGIRWEFDHCRFGDDTDLSACVFGPGTRFVHCTFGAYPVFWGSEFVATVRFEHINSPQGLFLRGVHVRGEIDVFDSLLGRPGSDGSMGLLLNEAHTEGLTVERVRSNGNVQFDDAMINGSIEIGNVECRELLSAGATCTGRFELSNVAARGDFSLRDLRIRKHLTLDFCSGRELRIHNVSAAARVVSDNNQFESFSVDPDS